MWNRFWNWIDNSSEWCNKNPLQFAAIVYGCVGVMFLVLYILDKLGIIK